MEKPAATLKIARLQGPERKELVDALVAAFPTSDSLTQFATFQLELNLETLPGEGNAWFKLVGWAVAQGRTAELLCKAREANPGNQELAGLEARMAAADAASASGPSGPTTDPPGPRSLSAEVADPGPGTPVLNRRSWIAALGLAAVGAAKWTIWPGTAQQAEGAPGRDAGTERASQHGPRQPGNGTPSIQDLSSASSRANFEALARSGNELLPRHINQSGPKNDNVAYAYDLQVGGHRFDLIAHVYNTPANQAPHFVYLIDFFEMGPVSWAEMESAWVEVNRVINFGALERALGTSPRFAAPLEVVGYDGDTYRPRLIYVQVSGRRRDMARADFDRMRGYTFLPRQRGQPARLVYTYDGLLENGIGLS